MAEIDITALQAWMAERFDRIEARLDAIEERLTDIVRRLEEKGSA